jgi:pimeloyl-ACP methyl ester carboxylesterase
MGRIRRSGSGFRRSTPRLEVAGGRSSVVSVAADGSGGLCVTLEEAQTWWTGAGFPLLPEERTLVNAPEGLLTVPGASLYYRVRGSGPLLLMLQGGPGDADSTEGIARLLLDHFAVVTYDRRGQSRSRLADGTRPPSTLETHSDDAHRLLRRLTTRPALVVGHSLGAVIGLDLVARHPEQVRVLVAHEPNTLQLLSAAERSAAERAQEEVEEIFEREGVSAALKKMTATVRADPGNREAGLTLPRPTAQTAANLAFFLAHDAPAARRHTLDIAALGAVSTRIVFVGGRDSQNAWTRGSAEGLAKLLGAEFVEFPGDHNGFTLHPRAFAAGLRAILEG